MALSRLCSWIKGLFSITTKNVVVPVEITVQPRQHGRSPDQRLHVDRENTVFAIENELQYARLWYPTNNRRVFAVPSELEHQGQATREFSEIASSPVAPNLDHQQMQNCIQKNWSHLKKVKRAIIEPKQITKPPSYIQSYLSMMDLLCVSTIRMSDPNHQNNNAGLHKWIGRILQLVTFVLLAFLSAFQSFCQAKYNVLWFFFQGGFNHFVKFSFNVTSLATSAYCSYSFFHDWEAVKEMTNVMNSYQRSWDFITKKPVICVLLAIITALLASLRSLFIIDIRDFSIEDVVLESSYQMSEDLFLWSSQNLNISIHKLDEEYGTNLNSYVILLAVIRVLRDFAYYLQDGMSWDLVGCVVITMHCWMMFFMKHVTEVVENVLDETSEKWRVLQRQREQVWRMYREIRILFEAVNNVFESLLILFHASNVLRYAFFMEQVIYPEDLNSLTYVHLLYNIVKSEITYIVASRLAQQNKVIRKWLRNWGSRTGKIDVGFTEIDMNAVLDELDEEPLGLGKGDFIIHQGFHFGLLGLVSSLFVMLASKKQ